MKLKNIYKYWVFWFRKQPWSLKWFLWLMLLMPFLSVFYDLKSEDTFSPLQIVGVLSFFISLFYIIRIRIKLIKYEYYFLIFSFIYLSNHLFLIIDEFSISNLGFLIRNLLPIVFYFYLRRVVISKTIFEGVLLTFLVSSIFPYSTYLYEFIFNPINEVYISEYRGGFIRLTGLYADLFSYMAYILGNFIIISYFVINGSFKFKTYHMLLFIIITITCITGLSHQSTWVVFISILFLLFLFLKKMRIQKKIIPLFLIAISFTGPFILNKYLKPLYSKEINVYQGNLERERMFNGRIIRWQKYFNIWNDMHFLNKTFGVGFSGSKYSKVMMSGGMHSDYVKLGFAAGILGLILYLLFFISLFFRKRKLNNPISFILLTSIIIMMLYAITSNPLGSSGALIYLTLVTFAFVANNKTYAYK